VSRGCDVTVTSHVRATGVQNDSKGCMMHPVEEIGRLTLSYLLTATCSPGPPKKT